MAVERTFSIIKPDATRRNLTGAVTKMLEEAGLRVVASKRIHMTREQAETFYAVHKARPFFGELVDFMISGPVVVQVLEGEDAIAKNRALMGATDPKKADPGTILFVSDVPAELDAASEAGYQVLFSHRPGNPHQDGAGHPAASSYAEVLIQGLASVRA